MAVLDVDEVRSRPAARRTAAATKSSISRCDLVVGEHGSSSAACRTCGRDGMVVDDPRLECFLSLGRQKRPEWVSCRPMSRSSVSAESLAVGGDQRLAQAGEIGRACRSLITSWLGLARPSWRTATASPPQISLAPLRPKCSPAPAWSARWAGRRACRPSLPSAGSAKRLPTVNAVGQPIGLRQGRVGPGLHLLVKGQVDPQPRRVLSKSGWGFQHSDTTIST